MDPYAQIPIRVLICDDHPMFLDGLRRGLEDVEGIEVVSEAQSATDAISQAEESLPDVILMDIRMSDINGIEATAKIKDSVPTAQVVMLTASEEDADLYASIRAGASGYLLKGASVGEIVAAIRGAAEGMSPVSPSMASSLLNEFAAMTQKAERKTQTAMSLTDRELQVLQSLAKGSSNREIARELGISENTAKKHIRNILEKLHLKSRVEAALHAVKEGLLEE